MSKPNKPVKVDMGDLQHERVNLSNFLQSHFRIDSVPSSEGLELTTTNVSAIEAENMVNKFVYHQNLNNTHWVAVEKNIVKINRFKQEKKAKENKHPLSPAIIKHGW